MKVIPAPFISALSGKSGNAPGGNIVFSLSSEGRQLARTGFQPANPNSTRQQEVRADLSAIANAFQSLTSSEKSAWQTLGQQIVRTDSLGRAYRLSALAAYQLVNGHRLAAGQAITDTAPAYNPPAAATSLTQLQLSATAGDLDMTFAHTNGANNCIARIRLTRALPSSVRNAQPGDLRFISNDDAQNYQAVTSANTFQYSTTMDLFTLAAGNFAGVEVLLLSNDYVPAGVLFVRNETVAAV